MAATTKKASAKKATTAKRTATKRPASPRPAADAGAEAVEQAIADAESTTHAMKETAASAIDTAVAKATAAINSFPSVDFSKLDLEALKQLDPRKIDWRKVERPEVDTQKLLAAVRDAAYVTVGFGVLAVQKAQVRRRELAGAIGDRFGANKQQVEGLIAAFEARLTTFDDAVEARVDRAVSMLGDRLPDQAGLLLSQVHSVAKTARKQVRGLLTNAA